jgi:hypothetical protein
MRVNENLWRGSHTYAFCLGGYLWVARRWDTYVSADQNVRCLLAGQAGDVEERSVLGLKSVSMILCNLL